MTKNPLPPADQPTREAHTPGPGQKSQKTDPRRSVPNTSPEQSTSKKAFDRTRRGVRGGRSLPTDLELKPTDQPLTLYLALDRDPTPQPSRRMQPRSQQQPCRIYSPMHTKTRASSFLLSPATADKDLGPATPCHALDTTVFIYTSLAAPSRSMPRDLDILLPAMHPSSSPPTAPNRPLGFPPGFAGCHRRLRRTAGAGERLPPTHPPPRPRVFFYVCHTQAISNRTADASQRCVLVMGGWGRGGRGGGGVDQTPCLPPPGPQEFSRTSIHVYTRRPPGTPSRAAPGVSWRLLPPWRGRDQTLPHGS